MLIYKYVVLSRVKGYDAIRKYFYEKPITLVENRNAEDLVVIISKADCTSCIEHIFNIAIKYAKQKYAIYLLNKDYPQLDIMNNDILLNHIIKYESPLFNHYGRLYHTPLLVKMRKNNANEITFITPDNLEKIESNFRELAPRY